MRSGDPVSLFAEEHRGLESRPQHSISSQNLLPHLAPNGSTLNFPILSTDSFYGFLSGLMITLFVAALIIIFVYEYEVLRRSKA